MIILNVMRHVGDIVYQGCKKIYDVTISPIVSLACRILFSEKVVPEKITQTVSYPNKQDSTSQIEQVTSSFFSFPSIPNPLSPSLSIPYQNEKEFNHQEEPTIQQEVIVQAETVAQEEPALQGEAVKQKEPVVQEEPIVHQEEPTIQQEVIVQAETMTKEEPALQGEAVRQKEPVVKEEVIQRTLFQPKKALTTYFGHSNIPYFLNRKGFPNPSYRNCGFNSLAVLCAQTGCSIPLIHPDNEYLYNQLNRPHHFEEAVRQKIEALKKPKEELSIITKNSQDLTAQINSQVSQVQKELEDLKNALELLKKEKGSLIPKTDTDLLDNPLPALRRNLADLKKRKANSDDEKLLSEIYKLEIEITKIEVEAIRFDYIRKLPEKQLVEKIQSKKNQIDLKEKELEKINEEKRAIYSDQLNNEQLEKGLEREIEDMQRALERQAQLPRGAEILAILRGEQEGHLTMEDAQLICKIVTTTMSREIYKGRTDVQADPECAKLREALYHSDWRGLRAGGHGHWWVYIRNPDGQTVDEINDDQVYRKKMTIDELFNKYSNPNEWGQTQITFYDGIKP